MLIEIQKNILDIDEGMIAHGVNCQHAMGSGVALAIKTKWSSIYDDYMSNPCVLGAARTIEVGPNLWVANCYTQEFYGRKSFKYADPRAIYSSLRESLGWLSMYREKSGKSFSLYMPQIGCGLGGLDYNKEVKPLLEELVWWFPSTDIFVCSL